MTSSEPAISFRELLAYTDYLAERWFSYFERNPVALDVDVGGQIGSLRDLIAHIFMVEQFFSNRLLGDRSPASSKKPEAPALDDLRRMHRDAHQNLAKYIESASEAHLAEKQDLGPFSASNRKLLAQAVVHSIHHWAQVAMEVRQAGFPAEAPQDIVISPVMD